MMIISKEMMADEQALRQYVNLTPGTHRLQSVDGYWKLWRADEAQGQMHVITNRFWDFWDGSAWRPVSEWAEWWKAQHLNGLPGV
jgi:hypothetical protein